MSYFKTKKPNKIIQVRETDVELVSVSARELANIQEEFKKMEGETDLVKVVNAVSDLIPRITNLPPEAVDELTQQELFEILEEFKDHTQGRPLDSKPENLNPKK